MIIYIPVKWFTFFRNNTDKRELAIAGTAAGVAAAFGSPIGGTLFAYEVASPCTGWTFLLTWKSFVCSCVAVFFLNILVAI
jgi:chloride channel 6